MSMDDLLWDGDRASDGTRIVEADGTAAVHLAAGGVIRLCPCCDRPFLGAKYARAFVTNTHETYGDKAAGMLADLAAEQAARS
jgi:hypothetical protein